jgi:hypothetical protein
VWQVLLENASVYLQKAWHDNVEADIPGVSSPAERLAILYGPGGRVESFTKQFLESIRKAKPSEQPPLPPHIMQALQTQREVGPLLKGDVVYDVTVRTGQRPNIGGLSPLVEDDTLLSVTCAGKRYDLSSRSGQEASMIVPWSYQGCGDVNLIISFYFFDRTTREEVTRQNREKAAPQTSQKIHLTKRYTGPTAFLSFLSDVRNGDHSYQMSDFDPDLDTKAVLQQGVHSVKVYYRVRIPPTLEKLTSVLQTMPGNEPLNSAGSNG